ncbi:MAG: hypothetical protein GY861_07425 [bacterium]|nr:hypothetical protein [bacterium]
MIKIPYEEIVEKIKQDSGLGDEELKGRIDKKLEQLSGLISKEGAAHIVANELGIKLIEQTSGKLQIKNILSGMRDVETVGKVINVYDAKEFKTEKREGKVGSLFMGDETGSIRVVLWNEQADNLKNIKAGDVVKVKGGYVRERQNNKEIHLNDRSILAINPEGEKVEVQGITRKKIEELKPGDSMVELMATIVQVFDIRFYEVCPDCGKRTRMREEGFICESHGKISPAYAYLMNVFLDDGTENMRAVFFRDQVKTILGKTNEQITELRENPDKFEQVKNDLLGNLIKVSGRVNSNEMFNRTEFVAQTVSFADPQEEINRIKNDA